MNLLYGFVNQKKYVINNFKNQTLSNSIIFYGQKGIGKKTFIFNILNEIISLKSKNNNHDLNLIKNNIHPNIMHVSKEYDNKLKKYKNYINIDQVRNLNKFINESSFDGNNKFIVIDSGDDLNINAANSILKFLEEPRKNTFFFVISHQLSSLLPTIRSRCLKLKFDNHDYEDFKAILLNNIESNKDDDIKFLYDLSNGSPGIGLEIQSEDIIEIYHEIIDSLNNTTVSSNIINFSIKISNYDNEKFKIFLLILKFILINIKKIKLGASVDNKYLSSNISSLKNINNKISLTSVYKKLEYLINNENDLFTYNLDKKIFVLNFFTNTNNHYE